MTNQEIIDKYLKEFYETHGTKIPIELNSYLHRMINEAKSSKLDSSYTVFENKTGYENLIQVNKPVHPLESLYDNITKNSNAERDRVVAGYSKGHLCFYELDFYEEKVKRFITTIGLNKYLEK